MILEKISDCLCNLISNIKLLNSVPSQCSRPLWASPQAQPLPFFLVHCSPVKVEPRAGLHISRRHFHVLVVVLDLDPINDNCARYVIRRLQLLPPLFLIACCQTTLYCSSSSIWQTWGRSNNEDISWESSGKNSENWSSGEKYQFFITEIIVCNYAMMKLSSL